MRKIYSIIFCFLTTISVAQKETILWYFSNTCALDFTSGVPVALGNSAMNQYEGSSSICDKQGNLLFYTDGMSIWNSNHVNMPNGTGLMGNFSSNQSALIVPDPANTQQYYVFCNSMSDLYYSVVDMTLNGGLGDVTTKNVFLKSNISEKLAGVKHANGSDYWIMVHGAGNSEFYAYLLTSAGVNLVPVTTTTGAPDAGSIGQMQFSPDGKWVAFTTYASSTNACVSEFDNTTGIPFNSFSIPYSNQIYGCTFSPNSKYFYHQGNPSPAGVFQYDLTLGNSAAIIASGTSVGTGVSGHHMGQMQIGPDKKVYLAMDGLNYLAVINNPDSPAASVNFQQNGVSLIGTNGLGLPNYVASYFTNNAIIQNFCFGDSTSFVVADSAVLAAVAWDFGDPSTGPLNASYSFSTNHVFSAPGTYTVQLIVVYLNTTVDTLSYQVEIKLCNAVVANLASSDTLFCDKNCIDFYDQSQFNPSSWQWTFTGASPSSSTDQNPTNICYNNYGSFNVSLIACNAAGCDTVTFPNFIVDFQLPAAPVITLTGNVLSCTPAFSYQWYIVGDTNVYSTAQSFTPTVNGNYYVLITDSNGCQNPSNVIGFYLDVSTVVSANGFVISPNPFNDFINVQYLNGLNGQLNYVVYDITSRVVKQGIVSEQNNLINLQKLSRGVYTLALLSETASYRFTLVKQ
ncbi:MAG: T9SS type A sorting domain-containing protein [Bacteroidetes bacterium]|nr:T9SS type A sorting domain-containing protein [Bacteroidota bacterium]